MGVYAISQMVTRDIREDMPDPDGYAAFLCLGEVAAQGLHPVGEPRIEWHEMTQYDIDMLYAGQEDPPPPAGDDELEWVRFEPGDWRVIARVTVEEDAPTPDPVG